MVSESFSADANEYAHDIEDLSVGMLGSHEPHRHNPKSASVGPIDVTIDLHTGTCVSNVWKQSVLAQVESMNARLAQNGVLLQLALVNSAADPIGI